MHGDREEYALAQHGRAYVLAISEYVIRNGAKQSLALGTPTANLQQGIPWQLVPGMSGARKTKPKALIAAVKVLRGARNCACAPWYRTIDSIPACCESAGQPSFRAEEVDGGPAL